MVFVDHRSTHHMPLSVFSWGTRICLTGWHMTLWWDCTPEGRLYGDRKLEGVRARFALYNNLLSHTNRRPARKCINSSPRWCMHWPNHLPWGPPFQSQHLHLITLEHNSSGWATGDMLRPHPHNSKALCMLWCPGNVPLDPDIYSKNKHRCILHFLSS